jgi:hypothetical protein
MRKLLYIPVMLVFLPLAAQATDWVKIGGSSNGVTAYYDRDNATYKEAQVDAWDRVTYPVAQTLAGVSVSEMHSHYDIDCLQRTVSTLGVELYGADGALVKTLTPNPADVPINPQSPAGAIAKLYCQNW